MKVSLDVSPLSSGHRFRGIGFYTKRLSEALKDLKKPGFSLKLLEKREALSGFDLVHYPYFDLFFQTLPLKKRVRTVVTIHDIIPLIFPKHYPPGIKGRLNFGIQKISLKGASAVITDSNSSKKDIVKFLGYPAKKISVVPLAAGKEYRPIKSRSVLRKTAVKYGLPEKFVLYVGDVNYHKNLLGLAKACEILGVCLVVVGKQAVAKDFDQNHPENKPLVELIKKYGRSDWVKRLGFLPENDLVALYNLASVYCQPSLYEGFGLPVLQALACGTPVVAARVGSLPEVGGEAVCWAKGTEPRFLAQSLKEVLNNSPFCASLKKKGLVQAKKFSWPKTALKTYEVYQKVVQD